MPLSTKARVTLQLIKDVQFLKNDLMRVFRDASTRVADNVDDENIIAKEIFNYIMKGL
jgi:hypothetical protein